MKPSGMGGGRFTRWTCRCCQDTKLSRGADTRHAREEIADQLFDVDAPEGPLKWATTVCDEDALGFDCLTSRGWVG